MPGLAVNANDYLITADSNDKQKTMDEQTRTKVLGAALAGILGFMFLKPALMKPIEDAQLKLERAQTSLEKSEAKDFELMTAQEHISRGRDTSLPPQTADAQRVYQRWLTNLAEQCKFTPATLQVTPGNTDARRGKFLTVDVVVDGEVKLEGLTKFLYLFEQADLKHRITSLDIESTGAGKDAFMDVTVMAQGMSVQNTPEHDDVFPVTRLPEAVADDATDFEVADTAGFPRKTPFLAQIGREMVSVTAVEDKKLTVERAQLGTTAAAHAADDYVQLFPVAFGRKDIAFSDYATFVDSSPFAKPVEPRKLDPRLTSISDKTIAPGESIEMSPQAEDVDETVGELIFSLEDGADGMTIDAATGKLAWTPAEDAEVKAYPAKILLTQKNNSDLKLEKAFTITIKLPNETPEISVPEEAVVVLGREFSLDVSAKDDGPEDALTFALDGEIPDGLTVDGRTLKWTPPKTFTPGEYKVTVKVSDGGDPAKSDSSEIALSVRDDTALLTRFTGSVTLDGQPMAFFRDLATNENPQLRVGDHIAAAEIDAEVKVVATRHVLLADAEGIWRLNLGQNLRQRELIEPAEKPEEKKSPTVENEAPVEPAPEPAPAPAPEPAPEQAEEATDAELAADSQSVTAESESESTSEEQTEAGDE